MILPVYAYGTDILRAKTYEIESSLEGLAELIDNMWETMYHAEGVGLAAPQIGQNIRLFIVDTEQISKDDQKSGIKKVFINPTVIEETGEDYTYEEGCLSIPHIRADVTRPERVKIKYLDTDFNEYTEIFDGFDARVIQHEYDHIEGILFVDRLKPLKKKLLKKKLSLIKAGKVNADYRMRFA
ncbi:MAG: peptide deformylase [Saprospiraceae bacterium]|nr:peptide deformylase [Saprospiraceae bacterium]